MLGECSNLLRERPLVVGFHARILLGLGHPRHVDVTGSRSEGGKLPVEAADLIASRDGDVLPGE